MATSTVSLKLLIDTKGKSVLFAEAGKDFVDFLFHILTLPLDTVTSMINKQQMVGSLANIYGSIENLHDSYVQPNQTKDTFLKPNLPNPTPPLPLTDSPIVKKFYTCTHCTYIYYISDDPRAVCPICRVNMAADLSYVAPQPPPAVNTPSEDGFVKGMTTFMVMDDLVVMPLSAISTITLLNKFVREGGALEEKVVHLGMNEGVKLLNACLQSTKVLTDVFLNGTTDGGRK